MPDFGAPEELYRDTAWYYARFRPPYPAEAFDMIVDYLELEPGSSVIDLGCGTGQVAIPMAQRGHSVWAVDPSAEMLGQGQVEATKAGVSGITWLKGDDV